MSFMMPPPEMLSRWAQRRRAIFYAKTDIDCADADLAALRQRSDADFGITHQRLEAAAVGARGERPAAIQRLTAQGTFHRLFRIVRSDGRSAIMRVFLIPDECDGAMMLDEWIAERAAEAGVPVPAVLAVDLSRQLVPFDFAVVAQAPGICLAEFDQDEERTLAALHALGATVARVHSIALEGWGFLDAERHGRGLDADWLSYFRRNLDHHLDLCAAADLIDKTERAAIVTAVSSLPEPAGPAALLHGDLGGHNAFFVDDRISALVDWEDALAGDPAYDIAFWASFHPERRHPAFLVGYQAVQPLPQDFHRRFWISFLRISVAKTAHRLRFAYPDHPDRPPPSRRIQLALQRIEEMSCASS
jgi:Ser/Thr protein kinase RdoA (MazF antagonist)